MPSGRNLARELDDLLKELDVKVEIGLTQQGHMETVERMHSEGKTWDEIGDAIGWQGAAVERWYGIESAICGGGISATRQEDQMHTATSGADPWDNEGGGGLDPWGGATLIDPDGSGS